MLKRIIAAGFIFLCSTAAWIILAASIFFRTNNASDRLRPDVASTWGAAQQQMQPLASLEEPAPPEKSSAGQIATPVPQTSSAAEYLNAERSRVHTDLGLEYRQKGLLWYSTYVV